MSRALILVVAVARLPWESGDLNSRAWLGLYFRSFFHALDWDWDDLGWVVRIREGWSSRFITKYLGIFLCYALLLVQIVDTRRDDH
jgi:hypothetical protein